MHTHSHSPVLTQPPALSHTHSDIYTQSHIHELTLTAVTYAFTVINTHMYAHMLTQQSHTLMHLHNHTCTLVHI